MRVAKDIFIISMLAAVLMGCVSDSPKAYSPAPIIEEIKLPQNQGKRLYFKNPPHLPHPPPMEHVEDVERLPTQAVDTF